MDGNTRFEVGGVRRVGDRVALTLYTDEHYASVTWTKLLTPTEAATLVGRLAEALREVMAVTTARQRVTWCRNHLSTVPDRRNPRWVLCWDAIEGEGMGPCDTFVASMPLEVAEQPGHKDVP